MTPCLGEHVADGADDLRRRVECDSASAGWACSSADRLGLEHRFAAPLPTAAMRQTLFMSSVLRALSGNREAAARTRMGAEMSAQRPAERVSSPAFALIPSRDSVSLKPGDPLRTLPPGRWLLSVPLGVLLQPGGHLFDLLALVFDDLLGHALRLGVVAVLEFSPGHVDRTLVVGEHPADEGHVRVLGLDGGIMGGCIFIIASM